MVTVNRIPLEEARGRIAELEAENHRLDMDCETFKARMDGLEGELGRRAKIIDAQLGRLKDCHADIAELDAALTAACDDRDWHSEKLDAAERLLRTRHKRSEMAYVEWNAKVNAFLNPDQPTGEGE